MHSIHDIVKELNTSLQCLFDSKTLKGSAIHGIAQSVISEKGKLPATVDKYGEGTYVGIDDVHPVIIYHKHESIQSSLSTTSREYGRGSAEQSNRHSLSMIVFLNRRRVNMYPDDLLLFIQATFPEEIKMNPYSKVRVSFNSVILNDLQVYSQEYTTEEYRLKPEYNLFQINYTVETIFSKGCLKSCPEE